MARTINRRRLKSNFSSARAAWMDIAKKTRIKPGRTHTVRPKHTRTHFSWAVTKK